MLQKLVTIKDVAREAGVSIGAVSKVLHGKGGNIRVSEATAQRIRDASARLNYRPNYHARSLRSGRSRTVGVVADFESPFEGGGMYRTIVFDHLIRSLTALGYAVQVSPELLHLKNADLLSDGRLDGVVWLDPEVTPSPDDPFYNSPIPVVAINGYLTDPHPFGGWFVADERQGVEMIIDRLMEEGHTHLGYVTSQDEVFRAASERRCAVLIDACSERGLTCRVYEEASAERVLRVWNDEGRTETAMICWKDALAAKLLGAATLMGLVLPKDLTIFGFDGTPYGEAIWPTLETISCPLKSLVDQAVAHLIAQIEGEAPAPVVQRIPYGFRIFS